MRVASSIFGVALLALAGAGEAPPAETVAYAGLATGLPSAALREQLALPRGVGLVVDAVDAGGPAQKAGVAVHDVITKLDDQWVVNVPQFTVLVRLRRPGDTVRLALLRRGQPVTVPVVLGEREVPVLEEAAGPLPRASGLTSIVTHADGAHVITLTTHGDDDRHVRIADLKGTLVYEGPLNTPDDERRLPTECRVKVETLEHNLERIKQLRASTLPTK